MLKRQYIAFAFIINCILVLGSPGDRLPKFKECVRKCDILTCGNSQGFNDPSKQELRNWKKEQMREGLFQELPLDWSLRLLGWECFPNCDYQCQRLVTEDRRAKGEKVLQFHGKWPFARVFGVQEFFSTIFSIANFVPNYRGYRMLRRDYRYEQVKGNTEIVNLLWGYLIISLVSLGAWTFSTIFHLRDTWTREKLDYYFAGATVLSGFYGIFCRVFRLYQIKADTKRRFFAIFLICCYIGHITRLTLDWSYTYNMQANVLCGFLQNIGWTYQSLNTFVYQSETRRGSASKKHIVKRVTDALHRDIANPEVNWTLLPIVLVTSVCFGMSFELLDFAPLGDLLDAHAIWHFVTVWPAYYWYPYMIKDINYNIKQSKLK
ncbi:BA75_01987T0 [Komagataella pastoris]|uniref:Post-GPI attachment to proteins factor 3 n=1 Tax=Komagataella pastoris TaxID=4922 RepID=A0A1B2JD68_PICPA|nr:BA75_01987T0 [Komagataella pastoris]